MKRSEFGPETLVAPLVDVQQLYLGLDLMPEGYRARTRERLDGLIERLER